MNIGQDLPSPATLLAELPLSPAIKDTVISTRRAVHDVLRGADDRLVVVVGPCSIHDPAAAMEYAVRLKAEADALRQDLANRTFQSAARQGSLKRRMKA